MLVAIAEFTPLNVIAEPDASAENVAVALTRVSPDPNDPSPLSRNNVTDATSDLSVLDASSPRTVMVLIVSVVHRAVSLSSSTVADADALAYTLLVGRPASVPCATDSAGSWNFCIRLLFESHT